MDPIPVKDQTQVQPWISLFYFWFYDFYISHNMSIWSSPNNWYKEDYKVQIFKENDEQEVAKGSIRFNLHLLNKFEITIPTL